MPKQKSTFQISPELMPFWIAVQKKKALKYGDKDSLFPNVILHKISIPNKIN
jgi:hypothetical protein